MLSFFKNHPFAVEAFFESSTVLSFAVPREQLEKLIPACLQLDTFDDQYGFVAVAMVQTKDLRPKGFPRWMGNDFFLIGYRIFVRYVNQAGKRLRGLYILGSETDNRKMEWLGNIFSEYRYTKIDITETISSNKRTIASAATGLKILVTDTNDSPPLPTGSPFETWQEARRFAGPLPFTFSYNPATKKVLIIEGVREHWVPKPVEVIEYDIPFLDKFRFNNAKLANAFIVNNIPYAWKKGRQETWK